MQPPRFNNFELSPTVLSRGFANVPVADILDRAWFEKRAQAFHVMRGVDSFGIGTSLAKPESAESPLSRAVASNGQLEAAAQFNLESAFRDPSEVDRIKLSRTLAVSMHQIMDWEASMARFWSEPEYTDIPVLAYKTGDQSISMSPELQSRALGVLVSLRGEWGFDFSAHADVIHLAGGYLEICMSGFVEEAILRFLNSEEAESLRIILHAAFIFTREGYIGKNKKSLLEEFGQSDELRVARLKRALTMLAGRFALSDQQEHASSKRKRVIFEFR